MLNAIFSKAAIAVITLGTVGIFTFMGNTIKEHHVTNIVDHIEIRKEFYKDSKELSKQMVKNQESTLIALGKISGAQAVIQRDIEDIKEDL